MRRYNIEYTNTGITPELDGDGAWVRIGDAKRAIAGERERCARVCDARAATWDGDPPEGQEREWGWMHDEAENCAAAIRKGTSDD